MRPLYKFIERQYLNAFFDRGSLRLGTVHSFKDVVQYGAHRGDENEGKHHIARTNKGTLTITKDTYHPVISEIIRMTEPGESKITGGTFIVPRVSPDYFLFCTSAIFSEAKFMEWHTKEKLDACYEIFNPAMFAQAITNAIQASASFCACTDVAYTAKEIDYRSPEANLHPAVTKERGGYAWQHENRMLWQPRLPTPPLKPWVIDVPDARKFCRPIFKIEHGSMVALFK